MISLVAFGWCLASVMVMMTNGFDLQVEETPIRHMTITTIPMVGMEYMMSLDVKPTSFEKAWNSVVHFTTGGHRHTGSRIKGVWFTGGEFPERLHICSPNYGDDGFCHTTVTRFVAGEWINIRLSQEKYLRKYLFKIYINGTQVYNHENNFPKVFRNVEVHAGDEWYPPQPGYYRRLTFSMLCSRTILYNDIRVKKGLHFGEINEVKEEFHVSFDIKLLSVKHHLASVLHFMAKNSRKGGRGYSLPALYTIPGKDMFRICSDNSNVFNRCFNTKWGYRLNRWINVKIFQSKFGPRYLTKIIFNGKEIHSFANTKPLRYRRVTVYLGSPHHPPADAFIRNLQINGKCPAHVIPPEIVDKKHTGGLPAPVNGNWAPWSTYSTCSATCGGGKRSRTRWCEKPEPKFNGLDCTYSDGSNKRGLTEKQWKECGTVKCPGEAYKKRVDGNWAPWSKFDTCTVPCGGGYHTRTRTCTNPIPKYGGKPCLSLKGERIVKESETRKCAEDLHCPVHGGWSEWSKYSTCSAPCNGGNKTRTRYCNNPSPKNRGSVCVTSKGKIGKEEHQTEECGKDILCPVHGKWSSWSDFTVCTVPCNGGKQTRNRTCNGPAPKHGGTGCASLKGKIAMKETETKICGENSCPVHGKWSKWSDFTVCTVPCNGGNQTRSRTCNGPAPKHGGTACTSLKGKIAMKETETKICGTNPCPIHGKWSKWSDFTVCTAPCNGGNQTRSRTCNGPAPKHGGTACTSLKGKIAMKETETKICGTNPCPIHGKWSKWSDFTVCTVPCNGGNQTRSRTCNGPAPKHGGTACTSLKGKIAMKETETKICGTNPCPIHGNWSSWTSFGDCSVTCNGGSRARSRTCNGPAPKHGGTACTSLKGKISMKETETKICGTNPCPIDGKWSPWSLYGDCNKSCGGGEQVSTRMCNNPTPQHGGVLCANMRGARAATESTAKACNIQPCPGSLG